jgi:hypothetical protein
MLAAMNDDPHRLWSLDDVVDELYEYMPEHQRNRTRQGVANQLHAQTRAGRLRQVDKKHWTVEG